LSRDVRGGPGEHARGRFALRPRALGAVRTAPLARPHSPHRRDMRTVRLIGAVTALVALPACVGTQQVQSPADSTPAAGGGPLPRTHTPQPTTAAITEQDLMTRLYI